MSPQVAKDILDRLAANFPGLVNGDEEVPGAEVVEWLSNEFHFVRSGAV